MPSVIQIPVTFDPSIKAEIRAAIRRDGIYVFPSNFAAHGSTPESGNHSLAGSIVGLPAESIQSNDRSACANNPQSLEEVPWSKAMSHTAPLSSANRNTRTLPAAATLNDTAGKADEMSDFSGGCGRCNAIFAQDKSYSARVMFVGMAILLGVILRRHRDRFAGRGQNGSR